MKKIKSLFNFLKKTYQEWIGNDPFAKSAIIAYYTLFSLPSLLLIVTNIAGSFFDKQSVQDRIINQIGGYIGQDSANAMETMIENATVDSDKWFMTVISIAALIYGATGVFFQLKKSMNAIWNVREKKENFVQMLINRAISFGMVIALGFLLLVSLVISAAMAALGENIERWAPNMAKFTADIINFVLSITIITALFAAIFKILPDVKMKYSTTIRGAFVTAILFVLGEFALGHYFAQSNPASAYGGAASVVLILLWVNYTCLILFFGAEITVQFAIKKQDHIIPTKNAELAYEQQVEELEEKKEELEKKKRQSEELKNNPENP
ncbi:MAG: YihY/virulence factor BrkB family protein [Leeuwenhoekiella sp.]